VGEKYGQHDKAHCQCGSKGSEDGLGKVETRFIPTNKVDE
jgi:hypothetical protein